MNNHKDFYCSKLPKQEQLSFSLAPPMRKDNLYYNYDFRMVTRYAIEHQFPETKYRSILNLIFKF
ncbi:hypothetical protein [Salmonella phage SD-2_S15]|uniref:Uncharacterized protein n=1 Tax=Escherichia phage SP27 TaxID=2495557 RepID=A0A5A4U2Q4_9CAUD|nr:hypothetical protein [Salmonella phage SD-2_S15]WPK19182.1 hypothetical protein [Salmonella phage SD-6_S16]WPK20877.1 hypothetical protein [Salmonella phage SD-15_S21]BBM61817.1 hypothetical protein EO157G_2280 [Escherichia phage SP27]